MSQFDVIVAGAGFAGLACAREIAKRGLSVAVLERKKDIRKGIHTTGILVHEAADLLELPPHLYKEIRRIRLYSPSLRHLEIKSARYLFLATDTPELMAHLVEDSRRQGVTVLLDTPFVSGRNEAGAISVNGGAFRCRFLVGADGAKSRVAEAFGLGRNTRFLIGTESEYEGVEGPNESAFSCFLNQDYARGYIGWVIPGIGVTQIGLAKIYNDNGANRPNLEGFVEYIRGELRWNNPRIVEQRGGLIPIGGTVRPVFRDNVVLVGDEAGVVSPLTAGGIHTALYYGRRLGELAADYLLHKGRHPGEVLSREYPGFRHKHFFRYFLSRTPNRAFDAMLRLPGFHLAAKALFFLKKRLPGNR